MRLQAWHIVLATFCVLLVSCGSKDSSAGMNLEKEKMQSILLDLHRIRFSKEKSSDWRMQIFEKHEADSARFHETLRYFAEYPDSAQVVYDYVQDKLSEEREDLLADERSKYN